MLCLLTAVHLPRTVVLKFFASLTVLSRFSHRTGDWVRVHVQRNTLVYTLEYLFTEYIVHMGIVALPRTQLKEMSKTSGGSRE